MDERIVSNDLMNPITDLNYFDYHMLLRVRRETGLLHSIETASLNKSTNTWEKDTNGKYLCVIIVNKITNIIFLDLDFKLHDVFEMNYFGIKDRVNVYSVSTQLFCDRHRKIVSISLFNMIITSICHMFGISKDPQLFEISNNIREQIIEHMRL